MAMRQSRRHMITKHESVKVGDVFDNPFGCSSRGRVKIVGGGKCSLRSGAYLSTDAGGFEPVEFEEVSLDSSKKLKDGVAYFSQMSNFVKVVAVSGKVDLIIQHSIT